MLPPIVVNFKVYREVEGDGALRLARLCKKVSDESGVGIAVCPPVLSAEAVARSVSIPVYSQCVEPLSPGAGTGYVTPSMLRSSRIGGTLINHSEHRIPYDSIGKAVSMCREADIVTVVCAENADEATVLAEFGPNAIAVEPPSLIGGDVSVTTADPSVVSDTVSAVHSVNPNIAVYCGAGVKSGDDVAKAVELGAVGVLLASGVVKSSNPESILNELISKIRSCRTDNGFLLSV